MLRRALCALAALLLTFFVETAAAQTAAEGSPTPPGYESAIKLAFEEFELGNYVEAGARFREAHRLFPNARTLRALGMVEYELKHYVQAIEFLEQSLASQVRALTPELREAAALLLDHAHGYVTQRRLQLQPVDASVSLDGTPFPVRPDGLLSLTAGDHVLEVQAPGYQGVRRAIQVHGGEPMEVLSISLLPERTTAPGPAPKERLVKKWWLWTAVGAVVVAGVTAGLVVGLKRDEGQEPIERGSTGIQIGVPSEPPGAR